MGRLGLRMLSISAAFATGQSVLFAFFLASVAVATYAEPTSLLLALICFGAHGFFLLIGYSFCCAGPKGMRGTSGIGIGITLFHALVVIPIALFGIGKASSGLNDVASDADIVHLVFLASSSLNNLNVLTDLPLLLLILSLSVGEWKYLALMLVGCTLEFGRMAVLGTIVQYYASEGKSHELGFKSLKFVYRILWVIVIIAALKLATVVFLIMFGLPGWFRITQTLFTVAYFLWWAFAWYEQYQAMADTIDVVTPSRFLDKRRSLDTYY